MLSTIETDAVFRICSELLGVRTQAHLHRCIDESMRGLLPYDGFVCGLGRFLPTGIQPRMILSEKFPVSYLNAITSGDCLRPQTLEFWLRTRKPVAFNFDDDSGSGVSLTMRQAARQYHLYHLLCHGQMDSDRQHLSYVVFNRNEERVDGRDRTIIAHLMPQLHASLVRISELCEDPDESGQGRLYLLAANTSSREMSLRHRQVLYLLGIGKTNWEIAQILDTSVNNVKYHVKRLNTSFGTSCRVALTTAASRRGILPSCWPT